MGLHTIYDTIWYNEIRQHYIGIDSTKFNRMVYDYIINFAKLDETKITNIWKIIGHLKFNTLLALESDLKVQFPRNEQCVYWLLKEKKFDLAKELITKKNLYTQQIFIYSLKYGANEDFIEWIIDNDNNNLYLPTSNIDQKLIINLAIENCDQDVFFHLVYKGYRIPIE
jgi:hypothetical protein